MGKIRFDQEVGLHNRFHVVVTDVRTGKTKQEAWAYNIILNQAFAKIFGAMAGYVSSSANRYYMMRPAVNDSLGAGRRYGGYIQIGTGNGTLSAQGKNLFDFYKGYFGEHFDSAWDEEKMEGYYTLKATVPAGEQYPGPITEVGLASYSSKEYLSTHAILEDSEGAQIHLSPGPYDMVTLYAISYIKLSHALFGDKVGFVGKNNFFKDLFVDNGLPIGNQTNRHVVYLGKNNMPVKSADAAVKDLIASKTFAYNSGIATFDASLKKIVFDGIRFMAPEGNHTAGVREIGLDWCGKPVFRSILPIPGVWTGKVVEDEEVGTGDGILDVYRLKLMEIIPDSEEIYVQGRTPELQSRNTDYEFNNIGAAYGENIGKFNYGILIEGGTGGGTFLKNVIDGDTGTAAQISATESSGSTFTSEPRLTFLHTSKNYADKLRIYQGTTSTGAIKGFRWQGSNDEENWTTIITGEVPKTVGWHEFSFERVGYKNWRFIIDSAWVNTTYAWVYELEWLQTKPQIKFTVPPESGSAITANYAVDYIPKDENHVLDISFTFSFKDANAE